MGRAGGRGSHVQSVRPVTRGAVKSGNAKARPSKLQRADFSKQGLSSTRGGPSGWRGHVGACGRGVLMDAAPAAVCAVVGVAG